PPSLESRYEAGVLREGFELHGHEHPWALQGSWPMPRFFHNHLPHRARLRGLLAFWSSQRQATSLSRSRANASFPILSDQLKPRISVREAQTVKERDGFGPFLLKRASPREPAREGQARWYSPR